MATTKSRITITITDRQHAVLASMSAYSGKPMSSTVSELLEAAMPVFERMAVSFQRIDGYQSQHNKHLADNLAKMQANIEPVVDSLVAQFDIFASSVEADLGVAPASSSGGARPRPNPPKPASSSRLRPPLGNTGVNHTRKPHPDVKPLVKKTVRGKV